MAEQTEIVGRIGGNHQFNMVVCIAQIGHASIAIGTIDGEHRFLGNAIDGDGAINGPQQDRVGRTVAVPFQHYHFRPVGLRR